jgi:2-aminoethylphosphonate-pyruvate transaminase
MGTQIKHLPFAVRRIGVPSHGAAGRTFATAPVGLKALVLAAGEGRSLFPFTSDRPKALLPLGEVSLLERLACQLHRFNIARMVVVTGYKQEAIFAHLKRIRRLTGMHVETVQNDRYSMTNTLYSLSAAERVCSHRPVLLIDGDVACEDEVLARVLEAGGEAVVAMDTRRVMGDEEVGIRCGDDGRILTIGKGLKPSSAEFLGISKFSAAYARKLFRVAKQILERGNQTEYYEAAFNVLCRRGSRIHALDVAGLKWAEIDFLTDYEEALRLFGTKRELRRLYSERRSRPQYLFCPGPVLVSPKVKEALSSRHIGHREVEFSELLNRVRMKLARVYGVRNFHHYTTVIITGSGSAANEAVLGTAGVGKHLLVISNGEFGDRLIELAEHLELECTPLRLRWGQPIPLPEVEELLRRQEIDVVCMVHHETSTGMLNPLPPVAALAKRYHKELYVDAVSSVGAVSIEVEDNEVTFCTGSSNKAIASVPGLAFICGKRAAFDALKTVRSSSMYLDLYRHFVYNDQKYQTPNTPAVNLFFALESALNEILDGGISRAFEKYGRLAAQLRDGLKRLGLRFFIAEEFMAPVLTTVELPAGFGAEAFHDQLKRLGYVTYQGKGILQDRVFQVANIGDLKPQQVDRFLKALARVIR